MNMQKATRLGRLPSGVRTIGFSAVSVVALSGCSTSGSVTTDGTAVTATAENYLIPYVIALAVFIPSGIAIAKAWVPRLRDTIAERRASSIDLRDLLAAVGMCLLAAAAIVLPLAAAAFASYQSTVVVVSSDETVTVSRQYMIRPSANTEYPFDQIYGVVYRYQQPRGENRARGSVRLVAADGSIETVYRSDPDSARILATAVSDATGLPVREE